MTLRNHLVRDNFQRLQVSCAQLNQFAHNLKLRAVDINPYIVYLANSCSVENIIPEILGQVPLNCPYVYRKGKQAGEKCLRVTNFVARIVSSCSDVNVAVKLLNPYCSLHQKHWHTDVEQAKLQQLLEQKQLEKKSQMCNILQQQEQHFLQHVALLKKIVADLLAELRLLQVMDENSTLPRQDTEDLELQLQNLIDEKQWESILHIVSATTRLITKKP